MEENLEDVSPFAHLLGHIVYHFSQIKPFLPTYSHLLISALFPIYAGAHASLSRPSSAAKPPKKRKDELDSEDEDDEQSRLQKMEGLEPSDALMFPLTAGLMLSALYFIIKWLGDPAILNNLLSFYFSQMGLFFTTAFAKDGFLILRSFVFPQQYRQNGKIWNSKQSVRTFAAETGEQRGSPLPGIFGKLPLPGAIRTLLWTTRKLAYQRVKFRAHMRGIWKARSWIGLFDILSCIVAASAVYYFSFISKPWWLTNFFGFGFCYGSLQLMSPSTFWTGSLILGSLFFYDIYFVFFTPLMVTVATKLDVPVKLLFPRPPTPEQAEPDAVSLAMLGLGDIVIPGMMIGLALRFDLFLYYKRKGMQKTAAASEDKKSVKPNYQAATGGWGERFWAPSVRPSEPELEPPYHDARSFPKTYFKAGVIGYVLGMITTLVVMQYFEHAQPALLYLVPGVLIFLWGTALVRGEIREMWEFSDADEEEENAEKNADERKEATSKDTKSFFLRAWSGDLRLFSSAGNEEEGKKEEISAADDSKSKNSSESKADSSNGADHKGKGTGEKRTKDDDEKDLDLFSISISLPRQPKSQKGESLEVATEDAEDFQVPTVRDGDSEPPAKRLRRSRRSINPAHET